MSKLVNLDLTVKEIVNEYPEVLDFLVANGFEQLKDEKMFNMMAGNIKLSDAIKMRKINIDIFEERINEFISGIYNSSDMDLSKKVVQTERPDITVEGVLPCPIRVPLLEGFEKWLSENKDNFDFTYGYDLKSANLGLDSVKEKLATGDINQVPDILLSAGFDLFFDKELMGGYIEKGYFKAAVSKMNKDFQNDDLDLRDPEGKYLITGVVPAVLLVNTAELDGRKIPETWEDILSEEFANSVSIPMQDLDLFNALIVNVYKLYGMDGIKKLARSFRASLHPAQMVKAGKKVSEPAVSIIPYFFTQMVKENSPQVAVWPKDGAVISPIFMMTKSEPKDKIQPFIDYFTSKEVGDTFSANGKFPSTNPEVDNHLDKDKKFIWVGWDFIHSNDVGQLIRDCEEVFKKELREIAKQNIAVGLFK